MAKKPYIKVSNTGDTSADYEALATEKYVQDYVSENGGGSSLSGSYNDLTDKPTIGSANLTIYQNTTSKGSFSANATSATTMTIYVPKLNGSETTGSSKVFYAPTTGGTSGYILTSNGSTSAPTWTNSHKVTVSTSSYTRYLVGMSSTSTTATGSTNSACYMSGGYLYSNSKKVFSTGRFVGWSNISSSGSSYTKVASGTTGNSPRVVQVYGRETAKYGGIAITTSSSVPTRGSGGANVLSRSEGNASSTGYQYLSATAMVGPNTTYYIYASYLSDAWYSYTDLA